MSKDCVVCQRISPKEVFERGHILLDGFTDKETIHKINVDAVNCINYADQKNRILFCGHSGNVILAGLFYILCPRYGINVSQQEIAYCGQMTDITLSRSYRRWLAAFPMLFLEWEKNERNGYWRWSPGIRCSVRVKTAPYFFDRLLEEPPYQEPTHQKRFGVF